MRIVLEPVRPWFHDLCSCLDSTLAEVLAFAGREPVEALGASWHFRYLPEAWTPVEFSHPVPDGCLMPHHPVALRWHEPPDADEAWAQVRTHIAGGRPAIVAVDNFHLPFRPAYRDVHAGHLVLVQGFDDQRADAYVLDAMPPAFQGAIPLEVLAASRASDNPNDGSDDFFAGAPIAGHWLEVEVGARWPRLTPAWVREVLSRNLGGFREPAAGQAPGLERLAAYLESLPRRCQAPSGKRALEEVYGLGWAIQADTALHADFLRHAGGALGYRRLSEAGRWVDRVAHRWTALRMTAAHGRSDPGANSEALCRQGSALLRDHMEALDRIELAVAALA